MSTALLPTPSTPASPPSSTRRRSQRRATSLFSSGEAQVWSTGGALVLCLLMIGGLLVLVAVKGGATFWPEDLVRVRTHDGRTLLGEISAEERYTPDESALKALDEPARARALEALRAGEGSVRRRMLRTGNYELTGTHYTWVADFEIAAEDRPEWAVLVERREWGRFYGEPASFLVGGPVRTERDAATGQELALAPDEATFVEQAAGAQAVWDAFEAHHDDALERVEEHMRLQTDESGAINHRKERARLAVARAELAVRSRPLRGSFVATVRAELARERWSRERAAALAAGTPFSEEEPPAPGPRAEPEPGSSADVVEAYAELERALRDEADVARESAAAEQDIGGRIARLAAENARYVMVLRTSDGQLKRLPLSEIVRAVPANRLNFLDRLGVYASRWGEFVTEQPRESNSEGGIVPAIVGTVLMTLIMSLMVVPFGVLAALYLREYAKPGPIVSVVRIAINNLAGVPSIVFGIFGLGFFCYMLGGTIDEVFFPEHGDNPVFKKGGLLWASLTLALLTLPVVIVATEEALAAVPRSMREGSYACGASKWQTIRRIVLPRAMPGIMTGMILAIARGAGEVAPLMLVGVSKLTSATPVDGNFPFVHPERGFMHLGFHIYDVGFQSQNSEAAKPLVFTTTLLLIGIVVVLNGIAIFVRARLRRRFGGMAA